MNKTDAIKQAFRALNRGWWRANCDCLRPRQDSPHLNDCVISQIGDAADALLEAFPEECAEALEEDEPEF